MSIQIKAYNSFLSVGKHLVVLFVMVIGLSGVQFRECQ